MATFSRRNIITALAALPVAACAGFGGSAPLPAEFDIAAQRKSAADAPAMRDLINQHRRAHGLKPLRLDPAITQVAIKQALAMAAADTYTHNAGLGGPGDRLRNAGIDAKRYGENVSAGDLTVEAAFVGWRDSPGHNEIMLKPEIRRMGLGTVAVPNTLYRVFWSLIVTTET